MEDLDIYVDYLRNSRELVLGSRLRQSFLFKAIRHVRLKNRLVRVRILPDSHPKVPYAEICLLGVWSEEYPHGMPLEFIERQLRKWRLTRDGSAPFGMSLTTNQADNLAIYSSHANLRLDFRMDRSGGRIRVEAGGRARELDLYSPTNGTVSVFPNQGQIETSVVLSAPEGGGPEPADAAAILLKSNNEKFTAPDLDWLRKHVEKPRPISINNPTWRGILSSSRELFGEVFLLPDDLDQQKAHYFARLFCEANPPSLTIQGFPHTYVNLVNALRKIAPDLPINVIWHGNFLQMKENYDWNGLNLVRKLASDGAISRVGFVKKGMAEVMRTTGMPAYFVMNYVRKIPLAASQMQAGPLQIGVWAEPDWGWRKPPYTMLAALSLIPDCVAQVVFVSPRAISFGEWFGLKTEMHTRPLPYAEVLEILERMHLNCYVTLSECAPMLPLESLSLGSPCLMGPTSHYFQDHAYLHSRLVVPYPEHAEAIAEKARLVLAERDQVIRAYREYAPEYNRRARQSLSEFLDFSMDEI